MGRDRTQLHLLRLFRQLRVHAYAPLRVVVQAWSMCAWFLDHSYTLSPEKVQIPQGNCKAQETSTHWAAQVRRKEHRLKGHVPAGLHNPPPFRHAGGLPALQKSSVSLPCSCRPLRRPSLAIITFRLRYVWQLKPQSLSRFWPCCS